MGFCVVSGASVLSAFPLDRLPIFPSSSRERMKGQFVRENQGLTAHLGPGNAICAR